MSERSNIKFLIYQYVILIMKQLFVLDMLKGKIVVKFPTVTETLSQNNFLN